MSSSSMLAANRPAYVDFVRLWLTGLVNPARAFELLTDKPAPQWGLYGVLVRFVGLSLTTGLLTLALDRKPFQQSYLTFLNPDNYYIAEFFFMPLFGLGVWLLGSALVHLLLRLAGQASNFDTILNLIGFALMIPMPIVWVWDWTMLFLNNYQLLVMATSHTLFAMWGVAIFTAGFVKMIGLRVLPSVALGLLMTFLYISMAAIFIR